MAILKIPDIVPQSTPVNEDRGDPALPGILSRSYWLFLNGIQTVLGLMASAVDTLQTANYVYGGSALTTVNKIPKVTAAGILGNSSLSDDGTNVSGTEPIVLDSGATPQNSQVRLRANALGMLSLLTYAADTVVIGFDSDLSGGAWKARNASVAYIEKAAAHLDFMGSTGNAVGGAATQNILGRIDLATGYWRFGDGTTATYPVDSVGDVRATGIYRVGAGGTAGLSVTITTAKLTPAGANGSMTFTGGILTAQVAAT